MADVDAPSPAKVEAPTVTAEQVEKGRKRKWGKVLDGLLAKAELGSSSQKPVEVADSPPAVPSTSAALPAPVTAIKEEPPLPTEPVSAAVAPDAVAVAPAEPPADVPVPSEPAPAAGAPSAAS